jgi:hypothetical protein
MTHKFRVWLAYTGRVLVVSLLAALVGCSRSGIAEAELKVDVRCTIATMCASYNAGA